MKTLVLNYFDKTALINSTEEAVNFINSLQYKGNSYGLSCNDHTRRLFDNYFSLGEPIMSGIATTGCSTTRIMVYSALAETLEAHNEIFKKQKEQAGIERAEKAERYSQEKMAELHEKAKGWYLVELKCFDNDFRKGGHRERWTNWKILANSGMDAYKKAVEMAEAKGMFWFADAINCQIDFYGIWTDEKEEMLYEEGLL